MTSPNSSVRSGFTLVELLVVITIIGMLVALLMPAINNAREAGRQATCMNNQRQYMTAIQTYLTSKDFFPGYRMTLRPNANTAPFRPAVSWQIAILPQLQRNDLYQRWQAFSDDPTNLNLRPDPPYMEIAVCPSDYTAVGKAKPWASYVVNAGRPDRDDTTQADPRFTMPDTLNGTASGIPMGVFHNHFQIPSTMQNRVRLTLTDIRDGQATTLMLSENVDARYYTCSTPSFGYYASASANDVDDTSERGTSFVNWWLLPHSSPNLPFPTVASLDPAIQINYNKGDSDPDTVGWPPNYSGSGTPDARHYYARPSSSHPGGVVVTFVGGNVQFLRDDINYDVYCLLMTPAGSKFKLGAPFNGPEPALNEGSFK